MKPFISTTIIGLFSCCGSTETVSRPPVVVFPIMRMVEPNGAAVAAIMIDRSEDTRGTAQVLNSNVFKLAPGVMPVCDAGGCGASIRHIRDVMDRFINHRKYPLVLGATVEYNERQIAEEIRFGEKHGLLMLESRLLPSRVSRIVDHLPRTRLALEDRVKWRAGELTKTSCTCPIDKVAVCTLWLPTEAVWPPYKCLQEAQITLATIMQGVSESSGAGMGKFTVVHEAKSWAGCLCHVGNHLVLIELMPSGVDSNGK
jgi:hypothetical protein